MPNVTPALQLAHWADQLRALSAIGLHYADDVYNQERYRQVQTIALEMLARANGDSFTTLDALRDTWLAHPTPLVAGEAAIIDEAGRMLLIRRADNRQWALPGGMLDIGETPAAGAVREALEETGVHCEPVVLAGVFDSRLWGRNVQHIYQLVYICRPLPQPAVQASHAHEVLEQGWFAEADLPDDLDPNHAGRLPLVFQTWRGQRPPHFDR